MRGPELNSRDTPCHHCKDRYTACSDYCQKPEFIAWKEEQARIRRARQQYRHEMTEQDHVHMLDALKQHKGTVILSGYPSEMYDKELAAWSRITKKSYNQLADQRTEVLWCNFEVPGLFEVGG